MNRKELIERLQDKLPICTVKQVEDGVKDTFKLMGKVLSSGERIEIRGFGVFTVRYVKPKLARNPKLGTVVEVPAKYRLHFKPGKELRELVNNE
jgi:integration host factor subunit beta